MFTENSTEDNTSNLYACTFPKRVADTSLKVSWDGNVAVLNCTDCCMRWYIAIDGEECQDPGPIDGAIRQDLSDSSVGTFDLYRPISVAGFCRGTNSSTPLSGGDHVISLGVGACAPTDDEELNMADVVIGYNSVSRVIIEEFPNQPEKGCDITT